MTKRKNLFPYMMMLPAFAFICLVDLYPVLSGVLMSFTNASLMKPNAAKIVWFKNFAKVIADTEFTSSLGFTLLYAAVTVLLSYALGLLCALLMNRKMHGRSVIRAMFLTPWVVPVVVGATAWTWILNDECGIINILLRQSGLIDKPILFLAKADSARFTAILFATWKAFPFMTVVLLSSLQSIPDDIYEACDIDGAGRWSKFIHITLPLIKRESLLILLLQSIWMINNFDNIFLLTKGGPALATQVISVYAYNTAFYRSSMGYASAVSVTMMLFMIVICMGYFSISKRMEEVW